MRKTLEIFAKLNLYIGITLLVIPIGFLLFSGLFNRDQVSYVSANEDTETDILAEQIIDDNYKPELPSEADVVVPEKDAVTYGNTIVVPSVGINALIYECLTPECGLQKGVWRLPDFNTPKNTEYPTVLAAHRWGPDNLSTAERIKNLFYNADKINTGDIIEITWDGTTHRYVVSFKEENTEITRDQDDLILITCKYYNSPVRILVYAVKID